jgi:colanic acid/amylovoran biosynthesis glycosyltransferase
MTEPHHAPRRPILVYRDIVLPRSETFIPRQYQAFERFEPIWIGSRAGDGRDLVSAELVTIGGDGALGRVERALFKQFGWIPPNIATLGQRKPALLHANFGRGGALALPIARRLGIPLIVSFHGGDATKHKHYRNASPIQPIFQRRLEALKREAALFVCVSDFIRRTLIERGFPAVKLAVNPYGIELAAPERPKPSASPYILFVGRLVEKKGLAYLLQAMALARRAHPALELVIVGDGPLRATLEPGSADAGARWIGWQSPAEVRQWMAGALAVAVPSVTAESGDSEGLPNTVLEAMAQARPVIGSDHAGIAEAALDGATGLICAERDVAGLSAAIDRLASDPAMADALGQAGRERVELEFDASRQSKRLETLLASTLAPK